jgi:hypothetical protein
MPSEGSLRGHLAPLMQQLAKRCVLDLSSSASLDRPGKTESKLT